MRLWRRHEPEADLSRRWKAFIESEPVISPARVPPVKPLKAVKVGYRFDRFARRMGQTR